MSNFCHKVLWTLLHLLANILEPIYYYGLEFREKFRYFIENIGTSRLPNDSNDAGLIEHQISNIKRFPKHLAVILTVNNQKDVDLNNLTKLVMWALNSGVNFISFYDYKG